MMQQWSRFKRDHPDCVILFRLGDFYEAFHDDAEIVADVCDVTLTSRPVKKGSRAPMAGVPFHAADRYIAQLVQHGLRVAIVEQVGGDANPAKRAGMSPEAGDAVQPSKPSLADREVVRIVSPGTLLEEAVLDAKANNHLVALALVGPRVGVAHADITTGTFATTSVEGEAAVVDELVRLDAAELVAAEEQVSDVERVAAAAAVVLGATPTVSRMAGWHAEADIAAEALEEHFGAATLEPFGCADDPAATAAAGLLLAYVLASQRGRAGQLTGLATYAVSEFMTLDAATRRSLELTTTLRGARGTGTLLHVLDHTGTAMGARRLRARLGAPLVSRAAAETHLEAVAQLYDDEARRAKVREILRGVPDLERLTNRVVAGHAGPKELLAVAKALEAVPSLAEAGARDDAAAGREAVAGRGNGQAATVPGAGDPIIRDTALDPGHGAGLDAAALDTAAEVAARVRAAIASDAPAVAGAPGAIRRGYNEELDAVHAGVSSARDWIGGLEEAERERTGIRTLKVGFNKVFGYYLEVPKSASDRVPEDYQRKQTLTAAERYITPEMKAREEQILEAEERIAVLERALFAEVRSWVAERAHGLLGIAHAVGRLDATASLAEVARIRGYCRPTLHDGMDLEIVGSRHPVVETTAAAGAFVPNDVRLGAGEILIVTGPNMAGKSTVLRQVALTVLMAQCGSFVPATAARVGLADRIFTRVGAQDEIALGQSTFMVEMVEAARILHHATSRSLVVVDELGRGTSTYDGMAIAWAVIEALHNVDGAGCRALFATHYHELTGLEGTLDRVRNAHMEVAETNRGIAFLHTLDAGPADRSYGVHVAELAGLPRPVTLRAWEILERLEAESGAAPQPATSRPAHASGQLPLLSPASEAHPALKALRAVETNELTPLEALNVLDELVRQAREG